MKANLMKKQIDWEKILRFVEETFPVLESDLEDTLSDLQTVQPILSAQNYPTRFSLQFFPIGMTKGRLIDDLRDKPANLFYEIEISNVELLGFQEKELKNKQEKISLTVSKIGKKHNLIPYKGIIILDRLFLKSETYTFKPKYGEFEK